MSMLIDVKKVLALVVFIAVILYFLFTIWNSFIHPFFLAKQQDIKSITLSPELDATVLYLKQRIDLTDNLSSVTLNTEATNSAVLQAEILHSGEVAQAAQALAGELGRLGIVVGNVASSPATIRTTSISLKNSSVTYRNIIAEKISTDSASIQFANLDEATPVDIRIILGTDILERR